ncbi:MAG TPA: hypothetical protein VHB97_23125 [Polyangia bacterium]|nr:hypothetical protein [Polyangia bacterium]
MTEVDSPAGRLVTFRVVPPVEDANAAQAAVELRSAIVAIAGAVVVCSDLSTARTFSPETTERFVALMRSDNAKLERSAVLLGTQSATFGLQVERMVREANHPGRRTFRERAELFTWLTPVLTEAEQTALGQFLAL